MMSEDSAEQLQAIKRMKERENVLKTIASLPDRKSLVDYAKRLKEPRYSHLSDLADYCFNRCINEGMLHGNHVRLPDPLPEDTERVDLHRAWLKAIVATNTCSLATINSVNSVGYLKAMFKQIDTIDDIGTGGFERLKFYDALEYSAEYLMRKYYSDKLREDQKTAIDALLLKHGVEII